jgi:SAM-dependent methyltransferase
MSDGWDAVAEAWDEHVDYVDEHSEALTAAMLDAVALAPGDRVLELATGPGTLGAALSAAVGPTGSVLLTDVAPSMVEVARRRNAALVNVACAVVDASRIECPDASFDVVVCRMGLMFTPDPAAALAEIRRVLAPGGRLAVATWAGLEHNPWMTCVGMGAMLSGIATGGPPVGPGSIFSLGDPDELAALAEGAGFGSVAVRAIDTTFASPDIDTHVTRVGSLAGPLAVALAAASADQQAAVRQKAAELAAPYETPDGYVLPGRALLLTATVG